MQYRMVHGLRMSDVEFPKPILLKARREFLGHSE